MVSNNLRSYKAKTYGEKEPLERFVSWVIALNKGTKIPPYMIENYSMVRSVFFNTKTNSISFITRYFHEWDKYFERYNGKEIDLCYYHLSFNSTLKKLIFYKEGDYKKTRIGDRVEMVNHIEKMGFAPDVANRFLFNMFQGWDEILISSEGNIVNCFRKKINHKLTKGV